MTNLFQASRQVRKLMLTTVASTALLAGSVQLMAAEELKTLTDRVSYIFGYNLGSRLIQDGVDVDTEVFAEAMKAAREGKAPALTQVEIQQTMAALQQLQQAKQAEVVEAQKVVAAANLKEGESFLAGNASKAGVKTTDSGLQYKVLTAGKGPKPTQDSKVSVHYKGTLLDGTEFDSSYRRGQPATFGVTQVIPGWTESLLMMEEGSKWEVYIPSKLAYGVGGSGAQIGPNSTLVFEIELLSANAE